MSEQETPAEAPDDKPQVAKSFSFKASKVDAQAFQEYLATLTPDAAQGLLDNVVNRATDVDLSEEEKKQILEAIIFKRRYREQVEVLSGFTVEMASMDEDDFQWVLTPPLGQTQEQMAYGAGERARQVRRVIRTVQSVGGKELEGTDEDRWEYWSSHNRHLVDLVITAVERFDYKVRQALRDKEALGKS